MVVQWSRTKHERSSPCNRGGGGSKSGEDGGASVVGADKMIAIEDEEGGDTLLGQSGSSGEERRQKVGSAQRRGRKGGSLWVGSGHAGVCGGGVDDVTGVGSVRQHVVRMTVRE
jgi:hypothetical protein